jgi:hypothetical protein
MTTFSIKTDSLPVEPPNRAAPEQKALCLLTDAEKVQIIHL